MSHGRTTDRVRRSAGGCSEQGCRRLLKFSIGVPRRRPAGVGSRKTIRGRGETIVALRGKKPQTVQKRLKALFYGVAGVGKTFSAIQFPRPYLIDPERGAVNDQYVRLLEKAKGAYMGPDEGATDADEIIKEVTALLSEPHEYRTLVIDPLTVPYNDLLDKSAKQLATRDDPTGTAYSRHKGLADRKVKHLLNLLIRLDLNVIITSHAKAEWKNGQPTGTDTYDCYSKLEYLFDLVVFIQKRGKDLVGIPRKSRIEAFVEGEAFPFSYDEIAKRYGREILERGAKVEKLASPEHVAAIERMLSERKDGEELKDKWLEKAKADAIAELPYDLAEKCVTWLSGVQQPAAA
jgi:hypothetical protein